MFDRKKTNEEQYDEALKTSKKTYEDLKLGPEADRMDLYVGIIGMVTKYQGVVEGLGRLFSGMILMVDTKNISKDDLQNIYNTLYKNYPEFHDLAKTVKPYSLEAQETIEKIQKHRAAQQTPHEEEYVPPPPQYMTQKTPPMVQ